MKVKLLVWHVCQVLLLSDVTHHLANGSRILMTPYPWGSRVSIMISIAEKLTEHGHDVYMLLPPVYPNLDKIKTRNLTIVSYEKNKKKYADIPNVLKDETFYSIMASTPISEYRMGSQYFLSACTNVLSDQNLFETLKNLQFDLGFLDISPLSRCYLILHYRLSIPHISISTIYEPWLLRNLALPSFVPFQMSTPYSNKMTFRERLANTWSLLDWTFAPRSQSLDDNLVSTYAPEKPAVSLNVLASRNLLWFFDSDVVLDYPRPSMPNEINVGGLTAKPAKPLSSDLENFLNLSTNGAVLVSFGSHDLIPESRYSIMMSAFSRIKNVNFIWRYNHVFPENVPSHIRLIKWMPQNDVLAHPNVKLFISHGGCNSQFEAVYHAVPMLTLPIHLDQPYNALRAAIKGVATTVDLRTMTPETLSSSIRGMLSNASYKDNIDRLSNIYRSSPMSPIDRVTYWVEHVLRFGGDHLHASALDMPWYQLLMLDIVLGFATFFIITSIITRKILNMIQSQP